MIPHVDHDAMQMRRFWGVLVATTLPFYIWGAVTGGTVSVGGGELPVSALMFLSLDPPMSLRRVASA
ncbi:hypothetical protein, partial [Gordonia paraffinivorans]|uniref:hypothetical protein n=1 Tax=Gordonia paraffinivorans TaxID=175628 RepID=UPI00242DBB08